MARINRNRVGDPESLRRWRARNNWPQQQLADALGIHVRTVSKWENGDMAIPPYLKLALEALERRRKDAEAAARMPDPGEQPLPSS